MKIKSVNILFIILIILINSCTDDPNSVGIDSIPDKDKITLNEIDSYSSSFNQQMSSFQKDSLFFGSSSRLLLGSYKNVSSEVLLSFSISLPDSIELPYDSSTVSLKSAWFEIYPNYWAGDSSNFRFSAHQINDSWNAVDISQDTVDLINNNKGPNILQSLNYEPGDTVIKFTIDQTLVEQWVHKSFDDSYPENYGILLQPETNNGIVGFQGLTSYPYYIYPLLFLEFEKTDEFIDTVICMPNIDIHLPTGERLVEPSDEIILQSALGVRGKLKFDLSSVPTDILVNSAILELFVDDLNSFEGTVPTDSIAVTLLTNFDNIELSDVYPTYVLTKSNNEYKGEIRPLVQAWLNGEDNQGVEIQLTDESRSPSAMYIYSSNNSNTVLRPKLTIYYSKSN